MQTRRLGRDGPVVSAAGIGCMGMSNAYGATDRTEAIATIQAAIDSGITLFDTADSYGMGHNEMLIGEAIRGHRDKVVLSVKFGALRGPDGASMGNDGRPASVKTFVAYSLQRLGVDYIDVYTLGRLDANTPVEDTMGALADLVRGGYIRYAGLSEVAGDTARRAHKVHPLAAVQIEYSLISRGIETRILPALRDLGVAVTAYGVLGHGLLSGYSRPSDSRDMRPTMPRFAGDNLAHNLKLAATFAGFAAELGVTPAQLAIAWVMAKGEDIVPLVGLRTRAQLKDVTRGAALALPCDLLERLEAAIPPGAVAGARVAPDRLKRLDSERDVI